MIDISKACLKLWAIFADLNCISVFRAYFKNVSLLRQIFLAPLFIYAPSGHSYIEQVSGSSSHYQRFEFYATFDEALAACYAVMNSPTTFPPYPTPNPGEHWCIESASSSGNPGIPDGIFVQSGWIKEDYNGVRPFFLSRYYYNYHRVFCSAPFQLGADAAQCEAYCTTGETWDPIAERCIPPPQEQNCKTQGKSPIDFIEGRKYRAEALLSTGIRYPFSLTYYFNNHRNQEKSPVASKVAVVTGDRYLAATKPPMTAAEYQSSFTNRGVPTGSTVYRSSQHYGSVDQYWRHNFDEALLAQGNQYLYQPAKGEEVIFNGLGSATYPALVLEALASGEEAFAGYKLTNRQSREVRKFDENGRLIKLERSLQDVLMLTYDSQNRLDRITNNEGAYIQLTYQDLVTNSVYSISSTVHSYPVSATNDRGESAQITWGKSYQGKTAKFHLITQITEASTGAAQSARTFEYNDSRWPASITDQYFVADIGNSANKQQTLHFEYDELGRAIFSGLNGRSSDTVTYVDANTRVVTNALGKQATYTFADFDGVKRLQSVTREPTQNCVSSEVSYEYDANGNISRKIQNGQVTEYQYDSQNREISRTEAAGTSEARTITTEYHPILNLPVRITEPSKIENMTYDFAGHLIYKHVKPMVVPFP